ncbi:hypothetical protein CAOG_04144 [Capsaspora owczarzaki ATCC 30864]|uniref:FYVE-type domain-containing protein n=1 Tax=Capsaspora owczarzaki (strain ATCC 30864) TaxID=595528 RepID=A0A0D2X2X9_CAPO3|nr:hypothetical protein CAOG_04144 [Capsaspora owczarzaki ATCC 30864]KJE93339.1 hypothetical protein CAOG_004144 [Capsaspora owczarzaki ATCC 30864]|eukprot:XP_004347969.2 hypothetical protein CAOG_04144 [Capsaspora owczarzaki ATCC 30864]
MHDTDLANLPMLPTLASVLCGTATVSVSDTLAHLSCATRSTALAASELLKHAAETSPASVAEAGQSVMECMQLPGMQPRTLLNLAKVLKIVALQMHGFGPEYIATLIEITRGMITDDISFTNTAEAKQAGVMLDVLRQCIGAVTVQDVGALLDLLFLALGKPEIAQPEATICMRELIERRTDILGDHVLRLLRQVNSLPPALLTSLPALQAANSDVFATNFHKVISLFKAQTPATDIPVLHCIAIIAHSSPILIMPHLDILVSRLVERKGPNVAKALSLGLITLQHVATEHATAMVHFLDALLGLTAHEAIDAAAALSPSTSVANAIDSESSHSGLVLNVQAAARQPYADGSMPRSAGSPQHTMHSPNFPTAGHHQAPHSPFQPSPLHPPLHNSAGHSPSHHHHQSPHHHQQHHQHHHGHHHHHQQPHHNNNNNHHHTHHLHQHHHHHHHHFFAPVALCGSPLAAMVEAHATPRTLLVTIARLIAQHDVNVLVRIVQWMMAQLQQFSTVETEAADFVLLAILFEIRILARDHPEPVGAHRAELLALSAHKNVAVVDAVQHCIDALDGLASRDFAATIADKNAKIAVAAKTSEDLEKYVREHEQEFRDFLADTVHRLPLPTKFWGESGVRKSLKLSFSCTHHRNGCLFPPSRPWSTDTQEWIRWLKLAFCLVMVGNSVFEINKQGGFKALEEAYKTYNSHPYRTFVQFFGQPFLTAKEQDSLAEQLSNAGFLNMFQFHEASMGWSCHFCMTVPDDAPPKAEVVPLSRVSHMFGPSMLDALPKLAPDGTPIPVMAVDGAPSLKSIVDDSTAFVRMRTRTTPPNWQSDRLVHQCNICKRRFNVTLRRHHCRYCGKIFCAMCSNHTVSIPEFGPEHLEPRRVCANCFAILTLEPFAGLVQSNRLNPVPDVPPDSEPSSQAGAYVTLNGHLLIDGKRMFTVLAGPDLVCFLSDVPTTRPARIIALSDVFRVDNSPTSIRLRLADGANLTIDSLPDSGSALDWSNGIIANLKVQSDRGDLHHTSSTTPLGVLLESVAAMLERQANFSRSVQLL